MITIIAILIFAGCFSKILIILLYNKFLEDSFKMAESNSELIKQIKLRFSNQIKLDLPILDVEKFVSRYIYQYSKIIKFVNALDMLSLVLMLTGIALNYEKKYFSTEVLFIAMFIYMCVGLLVASDKRERIIINNISDYLANNMSIRSAAKEHRVQVKESLKESEAIAMNTLSEKVTERVAEEMPERVIEKTGEKDNEKKDKKVGGGLPKGDAVLIEEVLRAFLQA